MCGSWGPRHSRPAKGKGVRRANTWDLRRRIRVSVAGLIALLTGLALLTIVSMLHLVSDFGTTTTAVSSHVDELVALRSSLTVMRHEAGTEETKAAAADVVAAIDDAQERLDALSAQPATSRVPIELVDAVRGHLDLLRRDLTTDAPLSAQTARHAAALDALMNRLDDAIATEPLRGVRHAKALTDATVARVVLLWLAGATSALLVGRRLTRAVSPRLTALEDVTRRFADGDLDVRLPPGPADEVGRVAATFNDMADRLSAVTAELERKANVDDLTGLANRAFFWRSLDDAVAAARHDLVVLYIDLDGFKPINDRLGHDAGDRVLAAIGRRLRSAVRADDLVARLGGDEFGIVALGLPDDETDPLVQRLRTALAGPVAVDGQEVSVTASVGTARLASGMSASQLVAAADADMYAIKRTGSAAFAMTAGQPG